MGDQHLKDLFYQDPDQIKNIIGEFIDEILKLKTLDKPFFTEYKPFNYSDELRGKKLNYSPEAPIQFIKSFAGYFDNSINWDNPNVLYNIHPNLNIYGQIASFMTTFANPNFAQDISSGKLMLMEKEVIQYISELAKWDIFKSGGVFTFGGKGTNLYALKIALDKLDPAIRQNGITDDLVVLSTDTGHPSHVEACNWLGIGTNNCIRLKTSNSVISDEQFEEAFIKIIKDGKRLPLIFLNGFSTLEHAVDDIEKIYHVRNRICKEYKLPYKPHIHVDSVIGWSHLFLSQYDFASNPLSIDSRTLEAMKDKYTKIASVKYADSFNADFHKTGFCSYSSSLIMTKDKEILYNIERSYSESDSLEFSQYSPYNYTLELSRPAHGPASALAVIKTLGAEGFIKIIASITEGYQRLKDIFNMFDHTVVLNYEENSNVMFFIFKPSADTKITANMDIKEVEHIRDFNVNFYKFMINKLEKGEANIFFSCSKSHKYLGQTFGSIKLYTYNAGFNKNQAELVAEQINKIFQDYIRSPKVSNAYNIFDFLDVKGVTKDV